MDEVKLRIDAFSPPIERSCISHMERGEDGGNWFDCARQADASYRCAVYADVTGEKISDGLYGFVPEDTAGQLNPLLRRSDTEIVLRGARLVRVP